MSGASTTSSDRQAGLVLKALDSAKTQGFHFITIVIAGMGFFTDAYDLMCVATITKLLGRIYFTNPSSGKPGTLPPVIYAAINGIALLGAFMGQLLFGWLGDHLGRKKVYRYTAILMICCSIGSALSFGSSPQAVMGTICFFRFWLGVGIGGDYPLSATIMSEYSNTKTRGAFVGAVFANQGFGILVSATLAIIVSAALKSRYPAPPFDVDPVLSTAPEADYVWRVVFLFGCVPALLTFYFRTRMPETARYTALVSGNSKQAAYDMGQVLQKDLSSSACKSEDVERQCTVMSASIQKDYKLFSKEFWRRHGLHLLGTASTWFLAGLPWYTLNLFEKDALTAVKWLPDANTMSAIEEVYEVSKAQALIALCSIVPGYWCTIALIDRIGRKPIQLQGFFMMGVFLLALGIPYNHWRDEKPTGFMIIYAVTFFFNNFGPNTTTFIVPSELYPARFRTTCHGLSAAVGKLGAVLGAFGFSFISQDSDPSRIDAGYKPGIGPGKTFIMLGATSILGMALTLLIPETKGRSLEEISGETEHVSAAQNTAVVADVAGLNRDNYDMRTMKSEC
ncbi:hypothetical protein KP509_21G008700 [Ceratopteris richardii]|uniref:Major facilitator superfamily (MFS) profile domain-containing protein n=1 Tax=Ceratopteris richardii TaxID=49495 RepID=A0A8T2SAL6_CERRI|nr:hypothetical protein KP509_21G008700 [Ceratopteris richardii]